jgi:hypothetical protein
MFGSEIWGEPMSLTILEDRKVWGSIPREITYGAATVAGLCTGMLVFAAVVTGMWIFWPVAALGAVAGAMLIKVTFYLKALPYEAYEASVSSENQD